MFVRCITARPKPGTSAEATQMLESRILPLISKYKGFREAMVMASHDGQETMAISIWDSREDAEVYQRETAAEVQSIMADLVEGTPQLKTYDLLLSTTQRASATGA